MTENEKAGAKKFAIYTGGFALYFFSALVAMFLFIYLLGIRDWVRSGMRIKYNLDSLIIYCGFFVLFPWCVAYLIAYIRANKIEVTDREIIFLISARTSGCKIFWPKVDKRSIKLADIVSVQLTEAPFMKFELKNGDTYLADTKSFGKADFNKLIDELRAKGVGVAIPQGVL